MRHGTSCSVILTGGEDEYERLYERHQSTGSPFGLKPFVVMLEKALDRVVQPQKRGPEAQAEGVIGMMPPEIQVLTSRIC